MLHGDAINPNVCLFFRYSNQQEIKKHGFKHCYQHRTIEYVSNTASVNGICKTVSQIRRVTAIMSACIISAVALGNNQSLAGALKPADQVLNYLLLFADLLYVVTGNDKDEPKLCNMKFNMDKRIITAISHVFVLYALIEWVRMFSKPLITGWQTRYKSKWFISTDLVNWLSICNSWYVNVNILIDFKPLCRAESITQWICIFKTIKRTG